MPRKNGMQKGKRPCPGMGKFVVLTKVDSTSDNWCAYAGANTMEGARKKSRELSHYPDGWLTIIENVNGTNVPGTIAGYND